MFQGNQWKAEVEIAEEFKENLNLQKKFTYKFNQDSGLALTEGLTVDDAKNYHRYMFKVTVFSTPDIYDRVTVYTPSIHVSIYNFIS